MRLISASILIHTIFFYSCNSLESSQPIVKAVSAIADEKKSYNYEEKKLLCRKLHGELKETNSPEKEKQFVNFIADSLISCWYGTKWNFYGMTETPKQGTIACGYFVTTIIRDAGIPIQRIKLAQCASEEMIKSVCESNTIKRFRNVQFEPFVDDLNNFGFGLYIIGLDNHTGFIFNDGKKAWFIHSSYIRPGCVVKEDAGESIILKSSKYKVIGKLKLNNQ